MTAWNELTDAQLDSLRAEVKRPTRRGRPLHEGPYTRQEFQLQGEEGGGAFTLLKTWLTQFPALSFSAVLIWKPDGPHGLILCRYNGRNHSHTNQIERDRIKQAYHVHTTTARYIAAGKQAEGYAKETSRYVDIEGAFRCLVADCNVRGIIPDDPGSDNFTLPLFD